MINLKQSHFACAVKLVILTLCVITVMPAICAKAGQNSLPELKARAKELMDQVRYTEAEPLLEKIVVAEPDNPENHYYLGSALLAVAANKKNENEQRQIRKRAREEFVKAKQLGTSYSNIDAMINGIPVDGGSNPEFSENSKTKKLMDDAEAAYARGSLDDAFKLYQQALALDPKLYYAALFSGDVMLQKEDFKQAEAWYQRAIQIDPNKETAYRYSATPLMKQQKYDEALLRYIEAYITEPYNRFTAGGLTQWAQKTGQPLGHPKIDIPTSVKSDQDGNTKIEVDTGALTSGNDDGSNAWIAYGLTRTLWRNEKFRKTYPQEKDYRHSLAEEADALRSVLVIATEQKSSKPASLSPSLQMLKKLNDEGLLEAYILLARVDRGIAQDHPAYLMSNREKLRKYVTNYVAKGGGN